MPNHPGEVPPRATHHDANADAVPSILAQLGLILTPAGLIAIFCQVLDVSAQAIAAGSLASAVLTTICIYRKFINRKVPSALLTALLVGLLTVFFFNYHNILLKDTGLIKYYRHANDFLPQLDQQLGKAQQEVWFVGTDFNISAGARREAILEELGKGVSVKYLIFDPHDPRLSELAQDFNQSPNELKAECEKGIQSILELRKAWSDASKTSPRAGDLQVRIFNVHPHARFYFFDPLRPQGTTFFIPYVHMVDSPDAPGYLLENIDKGVAQAYFGGIQKEWKASTPLETYLASHPEFANPQVATTSSN